MNPHFPPVVPTMTPATGSFTGVTTVGATSSAAAVPPQYAEFAHFDVSKPKGGEDALPAMPSWEGAGKTKVLVEEEEVEMDQLKKPEASGQSGALGVAALPGAGTSPVGSPGLNRSPYGPPPGGPANNGYFPAPGGIGTDPYGSNVQDYSTAGGAYGQPSNLGADQGYGMAGAAMGAGAIGQGRRSPYNDDGGYNDNYGQQQQQQQQGRGYASPARQDSYNTYGSGRQQGGGAYNDYSQGNQGYGGQGNQGYGMGARRSPPNELPADTSYGQPVGGYGQEPVRRSPAPQTGYGSYDNAGYDSRQYSTESTRPLRPPPQRQYSRDTAPQNVQSDAGFDFGASSYSRPAAGGAGGYRQPSPPQQQQQPAGYPGYKPYSPGGSQPQNGGGW